MNRITKKVEKLNTDPTVIKAIEIENEYEKDINTAIENGHKEGIQEGATAKSIEIAEQMLTNGIDIDMIVSCTGLSKEEIQKLKDELNH